MKRKLTLFGFFTLTASMLMSADEYPAFAQSGLVAVIFLVAAAIVWFLPVALCSAEMATIDGWEDGGIFTWIKNSLNERMGFVAVCMQWLQNTINFITMLYFIIGALSFALDMPSLNTNPLLKYALFLLIFWGLTFSQLGGISRTDVIVKISFIGGIIIPSCIFLGLAIAYLVQGHPAQIDLSLPSSITTIQHHFSISSFVPFILAFAGIEASASYAGNMKNPKHEYPIAILILVFFAVGLDALGGLAVGIVVPANELSLNSGVLQAVQIAIQQVVPALSFMVRIVAFLLVLGMVGEVSSWVVGPVRTLYVVAQDQLLPQYFAKANANDVPVRLVVLQGIIVSVVGAILTLLFGGNNAAFKIAMSLTVMMYMVTYILLFVGYLRMIFVKDGVHRDFQILGGKVMKLLIGSVGLVSTIIVFIATFVPSADVLKLMHAESYVLITSVLFITVLSLVLISYQHESKRNAKHSVTVKKVPHHVVNRWIYPKARSNHYVQKTNEFPKEKSS
ncbi:hypothetical protein A4S06_01500 [Erysipelotrichaceae bacterium MTC7]|nr:hypothetical protein A4S06_01500 [Erysipelotrichaceae bacterium MTC7]